MRLKRAILRPGYEALKNEVEVEIIDAFKYEPKRITSRTRRECIKKIWEVEPPECPK